MFVWNVCIVYCCFVCMVSISMCSVGFLFLICLISLMLLWLGIDRLSMSICVGVVCISVIVDGLL